MRKNGLYLMVVLFLLSACTTSHDVVSDGLFQKRKHLKGYHTNIAKRRTHVKADVAQTEPLSSSSRSKRATLKRIPVVVNEGSLRLPSAYNRAFALDIRTRVFPATSPLRAGNLADTLNVKSVSLPPEEEKQSDEDLKLKLARLFGSVSIALSVAVLLYMLLIYLEILFVSILPLALPGLISGLPISIGLFGGIMALSILLALVAFFLAMIAHLQKKEIDEETQRIVASSVGLWKLILKMYLVFLIVFVILFLIFDPLA